MKRCWSRVLTAKLALCIAVIAGSLSNGIAGGGIHGEDHNSSGAFAGADQGRQDIYSKRNIREIMSRVFEWQISNPVGINAENKSRECPRL